MNNTTIALGEILIREGVITPEILHAALEEQKECGCRLGRILIGKGYIGTLTLYRALAVHYGLPFADLQQYPVDAALLCAKDREAYLRLGVVPWRREPEGIVYAVTDISPQLQDWVAVQGGQVQLAITSPVDIAYTIQQQFGHYDDIDAREMLWRNAPRHSAKHLLADARGKILAVMVIATALALLFIHGVAFYAFFAMSVFYTITLLFKAALFIAGLGEAEHGGSEWQDPKYLPVYTILVPLYQEAEILPQLVGSIRDLDYPKSKLDVKLIVEEGDRNTIEAIRALSCERYFEIIPVPYSLPQTKPKACNYALKYAKGEYVTIYDAEDVPHPSQLKQVLGIFDANPDIACVQAKLNYYNREENLLTRMFSLEYGVWFEFLLPGLVRLKLPVPLGGTSNHIKMDVLRALYAWDPYNVTEDADLGIRLAAFGYKTCMAESLTLEESPLEIYSWLRQRSRWIKGYMQTYLVGMRHPITLRRQLGTLGFLGFQLFIGVPCLVFLINPVMWGAWLAITLYGWQTLYAIAPSMTVLLWFNLVMGFGLQLVLAATVVVKHRDWRMVPFIPLFLPYWVLHSLASIKALWQLITRPHWWEKTRHGVSKCCPKAGFWRAPRL